MNMQRRRIRLRVFSTCLVFIQTLSWTLQPISAYANGIVIDPNAAPRHQAQKTTAPNGVDVLNIAKPNSRGLSHNKYTEFNVNSRGLVLNNSDTVGRSQLGGVITNNPNLDQGSAASLILNEVTGANRSRLQGYLEVHGQAADTVVANPNGITCNGCGFINTPRTTLTTGASTVNNGMIERFSVENGVISIEGLGLDASKTDYFDIITRAAEINAELHAKQLNITTGRNDVDYVTRTATAKADDGSASPLFAISSSRLGGMYGDRITLVGTEAGVGVNT